MKFNERVLEEAENQDNPLCERLTFASIYQSNLDEFYMVRVGSLVDQMFLSKDIRENKTNMTPKEQLEAVLSRTRKLNRKRDVIYEEIMDSLKEYGVQMLNFHKIENVEYYTQIGTGNYNEKTARLYTDISLMTADPKIGTEAAQVFQALAMGETVEDMDHLLVAQNKVLAMIDAEIEHAKAGEPSYIGLKMNSLTDKKIMEKLVEASCAGVRIDMVIRGICCLIPQVPGKTENIHVRSIVGRFLEHSRIYIFGKEEKQKIYIASADWMTRNTVHRVEVAAPVENPDLKLRLNEMFITMLSDNVQARELNSSGKYTRLQPGEEAPLNSQEFFYESAYEALESQEKNKTILQ